VNIKQSQMEEIKKEQSWETGFKKTGFGQVYTILN
jgi:hypothetical protein